MSRAAKEKERHPDRQYDNGRDQDRRLEGDDADRQPDGGDSSGRQREWLGEISRFRPPLGGENRNGECAEHHERQPSLARQHLIVCQARIPLLREREPITLRDCGQRVGQPTERGQPQHARDGERTNPRSADPGVGASDQRARESDHHDRDHQEGDLVRLGSGGHKNKCGDAPGCERRGGDRQPVEGNAHAGGERDHDEHRDPVAPGRDLGQPGARVELVDRSPDGNNVVAGGGQTAEHRQGHQGHDPGKTGRDDRQRQTGENAPEEIEVDHRAEPERRNPHAQTCREGGNENG